MNIKNSIVALAIIASLNALASEDAASFVLGAQVPEDVQTRTVFNDSNTFDINETVVVDRNASRPEPRIMMVDYTFARYLGSAGGDIHTVLIVETDGKAIPFMLPNQYDWKNCRTWNRKR